MSEQRFVPIKELTTWTPRWCIKGRIVEKLPVTVFKRNSDGGQGRVATIDIMDVEGDVIRAKFWGDAIERCFDTLEKGKVYTFRNGRVAVSNKRYSNIPHNYELTFDTSSEILPSTDNEESGQSASLSTGASDKPAAANARKSIPLTRKYNLMSLRDVYNSSRELPFLIDFLGVIRSIGPSDTVQSRSGNEPVSRRVAQVVDETGYELNLTLWNELSHIDLPDPKVSTEPIVIGVQNVQIREFRGRVGSTLRSSILELFSPADHTLAQVPSSFLKSEVEALVAWYTPVLKGEKPISFKNLADGVGGGVGGGKLSGGVDGQKDIVLSNLSEIYNEASLSSTTGGSDNQELYRVIAEPTRLLYTNRNGDMAAYYPACSKCTKKVQQEGDLFRCEPCGSTMQKPSYRYMFGITLVDYSAGRFNCRVFNEAGRSLLGIEAADVATKLQESGGDTSSKADGGRPLETIPSEIRRVFDFDSLWKRYRIRLRARKDIYNGESRMNITVLAMDPLDYEDHTLRMLKEIKSKVPNATSYQTTRKRQTAEGEVEEEELQPKRADYGTPQVQA